VSDFEGIDWVDPKDMPEAEQEPKKTVAPDGYVKAKIIECSEHIKEENGNKSLKFVYELENGKYKNYREYLSVWHPNLETKKLNNGFLTMITQALGMTSFPTTYNQFVGKELMINLYVAPNDWVNNLGETVKDEQNRTKISTAAEPTYKALEKPKVGNKPSF